MEGAGGIAGGTWLLGGRDPRPSSASLGPASWAALQHRAWELKPFCIPALGPCQWPQHASPPAGLSPAGLGLHHQQHHHHSPPHPTQLWGPQQGHHACNSPASTGLQQPPSPQPRPPSWQSRVGRRGPRGHCARTPPWLGTPSAGRPLPPAPHRSTCAPGPPAFPAYPGPPWLQPVTGWPLLLVALSPTPFCPGKCAWESSLPRSLPMTGLCPDFAYPVTPVLGTAPNRPEAC